MDHVWMLNSWEEKTFGKQDHEGPLVGEETLRSDGNLPEQLILSHYTSCLQPDQVIILALKTQREARVNPLREDYSEGVCYTRVPDCSSKHQWATWKVWDNNMYVTVSVWVLMQGITLQNKPQNNVTIIKNEWLITLALIITAVHDRCQLHRLNNSEIHKWLMNYLEKHKLQVVNPL